MHLVKAIWLGRICVAFSFVGAFVAGVLTLAHYLNALVPCGNTSGCERVATDPSSSLFNIPISLFGFGAYLTLAALTLLWTLGIRRSTLQAVCLAIGGLGTLISVGLIEYAHYVIKATCLWCLASMLVMGLVFLIEYLAWRTTVARNGSLKIELPLFIVCAAAAGVGIGLAQRTFARPIPILIDRQLLAAAPESVLAPATAHMMGSPTAAVTIVEFADLACPACRTMAPRVEEFVKKHADSVRLLFRHYPLTKVPGHEYSEKAAALCEMAAERGHFWDFINEDYALPQHPEPKDFRKLAEKYSGPNAMKRLADPSDPAWQRVKADEADADKLKIGQTPTYIILAPGASRSVATSRNLGDVLGQHEYLDQIK